MSDIGYIFSKSTVDEFVVDIEESWIHPPINEFKSDDRYESTRDAMNACTLDDKVKEVPERQKSCGKSPHARDSDAVDEEIEAKRSCKASRWKEVERSNAVFKRHLLEMKVAELYTMRMKMFTQAARELKSCSRTDMLDEVHAQLSNVTMDKIRAELLPRAR